MSPPQRNRNSNNFVSHTGLLFPNQGLEIQSLYNLSNAVVLVPKGDRLEPEGTLSQVTVERLIYNHACRRVSAAGASASLEVQEVVDVGGLLGDFSLMAAVWPCSRTEGRAIHVHCFEPQPNYAHLIRASAILNGVEDKITIHNAAIGPVHGRTLYFSAGKDTGNSMWIPDQPHQSSMGIKVPSWRLDRVLNDTILLVKIDVEGFDAGAVFSLEQLLKEGKVENLIFELTPFWNGPGQGQWLELLNWVYHIGPRVPRLYDLHRKNAHCYGPLDSKKFASFIKIHESSRVQTNILATWDNDLDLHCLPDPEGWYPRY